MHYKAHFGKFENILGTYLKISWNKFTKLNKVVGTVGTFRTFEHLEHLDDVEYSEPFGTFWVTIVTFWRV